MNGLKFIRTRCNYSQRALAEVMGVSRQAVNMWEVGKKSLPDERKDELCKIFGIDDENLLDEISAADVEEIESMPLYRCYMGQSERFAFKPVRDDHWKYQKGSRVCINQDSQSLDEMCSIKRHELKEIFCGIEKLSTPDEVKNSYANYTALNRNIRIFGGVLDLCEEAHKKYPEMVMIYLKTIFAVIDAMSVSFGIADLESALRQYESADVLYDFSQLTTDTTELFTKHFEKYCTEVCNKTKHKRSPEDNWRRDEYKRH